jgi:hypothetical protein
MLDTIEDEGQYKELDTETKLYLVALLKELKKKR